MQNLDADELIKPIWVEKKSNNISPFRLYVATPCHSEVSLHYVQSLLDKSKPLATAIPAGVEIATKELNKLSIEFV